MLTPEAKRTAQTALKQLHCPSCGQPAKYTGFREDAALGYLVIPTWCCDTHGCEYSLEGPKLWMPGSTD